MCWNSSLMHMTKRKQNNSKADVTTECIGQNGSLLRVIQIIDKLSAVIQRAV